MNAETLTDADCAGDRRRPDQPAARGLPFGAIQLDREGTILQFNEYEANLSNRRAPETVGRNFFREVAPCTNVREFHGVFSDGLEAGS